jgi:hypothetical protein
MAERTITSKEMTLRNLASDITSEIRNQIQDQDILNIPLSRFRDENYAGNAGTESIFDLDRAIDELHEKNTNIDVVLTDDQEYRYFKIKSDKIYKISHSEKYLLKRVIEAMQDTSMEEIENMIIISIKK